MSDSESSKESKKYVHNCTKCGSCCEKWSEVPIFIEDLQKWIADGTIHHVLPFLQIQETPPAYVRLILKKPAAGEEDPNPSGCPLYDYSNKICNIYSSMPLHCASYPLAYNGEKFYLVDRDSPGLGNGTMTAETLESAREIARNQFDAVSSSSAILPLLYTMIISSIMKKSQEAMASLSDEDQQQLEELLSKSKDDQETEDETDSQEEWEDITAVEEDTEKEE
ncbi:MAG: YkgJ family cysteine cluster protein [Candidatus Heimdallarchaeota archaeon]|nr:YkgJ family cysteine cluster protein [Candidatus Heimdallarchaeota archaeon]MCK4612164.1 YkgJ family cysteine cluster protein [Candidatus Heimdallarchaeota archaeon]